MSRAAPLLIALAVMIPLLIAGGQEGPRITVMLPPENRAAFEGPRVAAVGVLRSSQLEEYITNGFPARLNFKAELYSRRQTFDQLEAGPVRWNITITFDQLKREFLILGDIAGERSRRGPYRDFADVEAEIARPVQAPIPARLINQRMYYTVELEIVKLELKDLDELKQWWGIEVRPAAQGKGNFFSAVWRGVQTGFLRILGGANPVYRAISEPFTPRP